MYFWFDYSLGTDWFDNVIEAWHVGHVLPVFSIGNSGPNCATAGYPGSLDVIGVGSTTTADAISSFSSVGPSKWILIIVNFINKYASSQFAITN